MYVRWQTYKSVAKWKRDQITRCKAILVESVRVDGKPRQKHIGFLGSYEPKAEGPPPDRVKFWGTARVRLDRLGNRLSPDDRLKIEDALSLRVPMAPDEMKRARDWQAVSGHSR